MQRLPGGITCHSRDGPEMDRVKTPMLLALGDGVLILNAKEILVHEKEYPGVSEDAELVTAGFSTV